ncbi:hypothetical protein H9P43_001390 [Blastocladiella emersonii ATCC 22665]|nr:hypothetical protein H9P43_001390 [Blastocladiella emersonii ATCC 22665]
MPASAVAHGTGPVSDHHHHHGHAAEPHASLRRTRSGGAGSDSLAAAASHDSSRDASAPPPPPPPPTLLTSGAAAAKSTAAAAAVSPVVPLTPSALFAAAAAETPSTTTAGWAYSSSLPVSPATFMGRVASPAAWSTSLPSASELAATHPPSPPIALAPVSIHGAAATPPRSPTSAGIVPPPPIPSEHDSGSVPRLVDPVIPLPAFSSEALATPARRHHRTSRSPRSRSPGRPPRNPSPSARARTPAAAVGGKGKRRTGLAAAVNRRAAAAAVIRPHSHASSPGSLASSSLPSRSGSLRTSAGFLHHDDDDNSDEDPEALLEPYVYGSSLAASSLIHARVPDGFGLVRRSSSDGSLPLLAVPARFTSIPTTPIAAQAYIRARDRQRRREEERQQQQQLRPKSALASYRRGSSGGDKYAAWTGAASSYDGGESEDDGHHHHDVAAPVQQQQHRRPRLSVQARYAHHHYGATADQHPHAQSGAEAMFARIFRQPPRSQPTSRSPPPPPPHRARTSRGVAGDRHDDEALGVSDKSPDDRDSAAGSQFGDGSARGGGAYWWDPAAVMAAGPGSSSRGSSPSRVSPFLLGAGVRGNSGGSPASGIHSARYVPPGPGPGSYAVDIGSDDDDYDYDEDYAYAYGSKQQQCAAAPTERTALLHRYASSRLRRTGDSRDASTLSINYAGGSGARYDPPPPSRLIALVILLAALTGFIVLVVFLVYASTHPLVAFKVHVAATRLATDDTTGTLASIGLDLNVSGHNKNYMSDIVLRQDLPLDVVLVEWRRPAPVVGAAAVVEDDDDDEDDADDVPPASAPPAAAPAPFTCDSIPAQGRAFLGHLTLHKHKNHFTFPPGATSKWRVTADINRPSAVVPPPPGHGDGSGDAGIWDRYAASGNNSAVQYYLAVHGEYGYTQVWTVERKLPVCMVHRLPPPSAPSSS